MTDVEKIAADGIMAIIPLYIEMKGNSTKIITFNSEDYHIYKSVKSVISLFARYFMVDLNASRKYYGNVLGCVNIVPIPFNKDIILVPIKVRKPLSRNDGSLGYINLNYIKNIEQKENNVQIILDNEKIVKSIQSYSSVHKHIKDARLVKQIYNERDTSIVAENGGFYKEFNKPATKGDIAALKNELMDLKNRLYSAIAKNESHIE